jgi:geranylgeranyl transferase type-2 subunit beta
MSIEAEAEVTTMKTSDEPQQQSTDVSTLLLADAPPFCTSKHIQYVSNLAAALEGTFEGALTNHLRLSGVYWSVACMFVLCGGGGQDNAITKVDEQMGLLPKNDGSGNESIIEWVETCFDETTGGYGGDKGQDAHVLYTLSALQILAMADCMDTELSAERKTKIVSFIASLQQPDGSFVGDAGQGEVDTRFSYCALSALSLLGKLDAIDLKTAVSYIEACYNPLDGGYGSCIGAESHAGQVFCCIGALSIAKALPNKTDKLFWWLSERQCDSGGLNGRSEKQADVCYSWWILSAMSIMGMVHYIDEIKLGQFILKAQDPDDGGIADRPEDMADVFHTFFGVAGLSLLGFLKDDKNENNSKHTFGAIDPVYALPVSTVQRMRLQAQVMVSKGRDIDARLKQYAVVERD